ncbi:hypothetical protein AAur_pTC10201 (plasmid) [Paenarthrobacter aurescens TC1]|uniref:PASTA domain-containing protein n=1 Tax=Paenarthrobacter aurescens (strain TC1) TaxID=290340 RepID=A1RCW1_PAEAT|nr:hypothetical protein AAur_pTC10201 [Paenarthrobacter aurescens TC1]
MKKFRRDTTQQISRRRQRSQRQDQHEAIHQIPLLSNGSITTHRAEFSARTSGGSGTPRLPTNRCADLVAACPFPDDGHLLRRTGNRAVGAEHAAIPCQGTKPLLASRAYPEELARISWHLCGGWVSAFRARECRCQFDCHVFILPSGGGGHPDATHGLLLSDCEKQTIPIGGVMPDEPTDDQRAAEFVVVPDVVGERFLSARDVALSAGLALANPDPDGRPISAIAWPNNPVVQSQSPGPGSVLYRNDSLRVWLRIDREPDMAHKLDEPPPSVDWEHATSDKPTQSRRRKAALRLRMSLGARG